MRLLILFFLLLQLSWADKSEVCYSVSLLSAVNTTQNELKLLKKYGSSQECKILTIGSMLSVRCGCYKRASKARQKLELLKKKGNYKNIIVAPTYRYRFEGVKQQKKVQVSVPMTPPAKELNATAKIKPKPAVADVVEKLPVEPPKESEIVEEISNYEMIELNAEPFQDNENEKIIDVTLIGRYLRNKSVYKSSH